jgi:hypothetical protein
MKPEPTMMYPPDEYTMDGFSESYAMQLIRDDVDPDPFNPHPGSDFLAAFEPAPEHGSTEWINPWIKPEPAPVPDPGWQQLVLNLNSPPRQRRPSTDSTHTSLTPVLAALELPRGPALPDELDYTALGCRRRDDMPKDCAQSQGVDNIGEYQNCSNQVYYGGFSPECLRNNGFLAPPDPGDVITIGTYTRAERAAKLLRFRQKRERRNFTKRVLYCCRKQYADSRPRVGGRFVVNENRVIKPKSFLKRGRPRKTAFLPVVSYLAAAMI